MGINNVYESSIPFKAKYSHLNENSIDDEKLDDVEQLKLRDEFKLSDDEINNPYEQSYEARLPESSFHEDTKNDANIRLDNNEKVKMLKTIIMGMDNNSVDFEDSVSSFETNSRNVKIKKEASINSQYVNQYSHPLAEQNSRKAPDVFAKK